jgi:ABC-2 type transport system ATP-binding protein
MDATPLGPALSVHGLSKRYAKEQALSELSFEVQAGEIVGLIGPNGAGKTTALRTIAGVLPVQSGEVRVCGFDVARHEEEAKRRLAWVPDDPEPFDALTVLEHLEFTAELYRVADWKGRAEAWLARLELQEKRAALGGELSRGMRQKLALCCAFLPRPALVLLDEPLSGLDPRGIRAAKGALSELAREGAAVLLSSHQLELVSELASRILILDRGRRVFLGTLEEARALHRSAEGTSLEAIFFAATGAAEPLDAAAGARAPGAGGGA